ncbi:conserved protein of unknown function [Tenacibaculum sp. 190130A14a]|uniref:Uncharacterized protein n=1 Tax=Tenacibaculum polynesiense TaxID=3137857 RepID=A0ABP1F7F6_9FLAO
MKQVYNLHQTNDAILEILRFNEKRLTAQFVTSMNQPNALKVLNNTSILRKEVEVGAGAIPLVDSNTRKVIGVSDFNENRLANDEVLIVEKIRVGYDVNAASGKETELTYQKTMPASFRNSILRLRQAGIVIGEFPMSDIQNKYTGNSMKDDYLELKHPLVLVGGAEFDFEIVFPSGATQATDKEYFELAFDGHKIIRSSK